LMILMKIWTVNITSKQIWLIYKHSSKECFFMTYNVNINHDL
jgi:hypothetical protein